MKIGSNIIASEEELASMGISIEDLQKSLTLPNPEYKNALRFGKFYKKVDPYICYLRKDGDKYIVPRYYAGDQGYRGHLGRQIAANFKFDLRPYQKDFIEDNYKTIKEESGILLEASCGSGKTILAIYLSLLRGRQTLVIVPTNFLAKQWKQRIEESTDASCFVLRATDKSVPLDKDFTIISMDLFSCRTLPKGFVANVGHVILDEAHRVGAETYLPILDEIPACYRTALTATFRRSDGVHRILAYHFGRHLIMKSKFPKPSVYGVKTGVKAKNLLSKSKKYQAFLDFMDRHGFPYLETKGTISFTYSPDMHKVLDEDYRVGSIGKTAYKEVESCLKRSEDAPYSVVDSFLNEHPGRRKLAISLIQECMDSGRNVLFLSKRKDILRTLQRYFESVHPMLIVSETNARSCEDEEYLQRSCPLIFGVTQLAKEGLDIDRLATLIIHLPMKDTEQAIGRVSRVCASKKPPIVFYLLDDFPIAYAVYNNAKKFIRINAELMGEIHLCNVHDILI